MLRTVLVRLRNQWLGALALLIALGTGTAYAANTDFSSDIVDGEVRSADLQELDHQRARRCWTASCTPARVR